MLFKVVLRFYEASVLIELVGETVELVTLLKLFVKLEKVAEF